MSSLPPYELSDVLMSDNVLHKSGPAAVEVWLRGEREGEIL